MFRRGVASRLMAGLVGLTALGVLAASLALYGTNEFRRGFDGIALVRLGQLVAMAKLAQQSQVIAASAPRLIAAGDRFELDRQVEHTRDLFALLDAAFDELRATGAAPETVDALAAFRPRMVENLERLAALVAARQTAEKDLLADITALDRMASDARRMQARLSEFTLADGREGAARGSIEALDAMVNVTDTLRNVTDDISQAVGIMLRVTSVTVPAQLGRMENDARAVAERARATAPDLPSAMAEGFIGIVDQVAAMASGPSSVFATRRRQLETLNRLQGELTRTNLVVGQFVSGVSQRFTELQGSIAKERQDFAKLIGTGSNLLAIIVVAAVLGALAIFVYLRRRVIGRLTGLQQVMTANAEGQPVPVPVAGDDEIADMGRAFRYFIDQVDQREAALKVSEARFRTLIEGSIQGIVIHRGFKPLFANRAFAEMTGFGTVEAVLAQPSLLDLVPEANRAWAREQYDVLLRGGRPSRVRTANLRRDGSVHWVDLTEQVVDWMGEPALQSILVDVTREVEAEAEVARKSAQLEAAMTAMPNGIMMVDQRGGVVLHNQRYRDVWRDTPEGDLTGRPFRALVEHGARAGNFIGEDADAAIDRVMAMLAAGQPMHHEQVLPDGRTILVQGNPERDGGYVLTYTDITEQKRTQVALRRAKEDAEEALRRLAETNAELNRAHASINEGIRYARRIQLSLLPGPNAHHGLLDDVAVAWQPLDAVGGDYYWIGAVEGRCVVAVMDCTGHGVPGAFMTAIVASILTRILQERRPDDPAAILAEMNGMVRAALRQDDADVGSNDGLDAAVCVIDPKERRLAFAGANLPLLYHANGELHLVKGDRQSLGYPDSRPEHRFARHELPLEAGMRFYLFTDGVIDQIGGPSRRLFGRRRLQELLRAVAALPMEEQLRRVEEALAAYRGAERRRDDLTFIGFVPHLAPAEPASAEREEMPA